VGGWVVGWFSCVCACMYMCLYAGMHVRMKMSTYARYMRVYVADIYSVHTVQVYMCHIVPQNIPNTIWYKYQRPMITTSMDKVVQIR